MDHFLFNLPDCLVCDILSTWLNFADNRSLDMALCNKAIRENFEVFKRSNRIKLFEPVIVQRVEMAQALENGLCDEEENVTPNEHGGCNQVHAWYRPRLRHEYQRMLSVLTYLVDRNLHATSVVMCDHPETIRTLPVVQSLHRHVEELRLVMGPDGSHMEIENFLGQFSAFQCVKSLALKCVRTPVSAAEAMTAALQLFPRLEKLRIHSHGNFLRHGWSPTGLSPSSKTVACNLRLLEISKYVRLSLDAYMGLFADSSCSFPCLETLILYAELQTTLEYRRDVSFHQLCVQLAAMRETHAMTQLKRLEGNLLWLFPLLTSLTPNVQRLLIVAKSLEPVVKMQSSMDMRVIAGEATDNFSTRQLLATLSTCRSTERSTQKDGLLVAPLHALKGLDIVIYLPNFLSPLLEAFRFASFLGDGAVTPQLQSLRIDAPESQFAVFNHPHDMIDWFFCSAPSHDVYENLERLVLSYDALIGSQLSTGPDRCSFWQEILSGRCPNLRFLKYRSNEHDVDFYDAFAMSICQLPRLQQIDLSHLPLYGQQIDALEFLLCLRAVGSQLSQVTLQWQALPRIHALSSFTWTDFLSSLPCLQSLSIAVGSTSASLSPLDGAMSPTLQSFSRIPSFSFHSPSHGNMPISCMTPVAMGDYASAVVSVNTTDTVAPVSLETSARGVSLASFFRPLVDHQSSSIRHLSLSFPYVVSSTTGRSCVHAAHPFLWNATVEDVVASTKRLRKLRRCSVGTFDVEQSHLDQLCEQIIRREFDTASATLPISYKFYGR